MDTGKAFVGFREGPINFPPTFKYDVPRTLKSARRRKSKIERKKHLEAKTSRLTDVEERELAELETEEAEDEGENEVEEAASMSSSVWTSVHSKVGTDRCVDEDDDYFHATPSTQTMSASASKISLAASAAAHKAKAKWLSLLSQSRVTTPNESWVKKSHSITSSVDVASRNLLVPAQADRASSLDAVDNTLQPPPPVILVSSTNSNFPNENEDEGVYDTSAKQRVPSWCVNLALSLYTLLIR